MRSAARACVFFFVMLSAMHEAGDNVAWRTRLVRRLGTPRLSEARFKGGFEHASFVRSAKGATKSFARGNATPATDVVILARTVSQTDRAFLLFASGQTSEAIDMLAADCNATMGGRGACTDLSAALLHRGSEEDRAEDFVAAADAALEALAVDSRDREAPFNLALAYERLGLLDLALERWSEVARNESNGWRDEADAHAADLQRRRESRERALELSKAISEAGTRLDLGVLTRTATERPDLVRDAIAADVLPAVARGSAARRRDGLTDLDQLLTVLEAADGDPMDRDTVEAIRRGSGNIALAAAHARYARAAQSLRRRQVGRAREDATAALKVFDAHGSPYALWAEYQLLLAEFYAGNRHGLEHRFDALLEKENRRYARLRSKVLWMRALVRQITTTNVFGALVDQREAALLLTSTAQWGDYPGLAIQLAATFEQVGRFDESAHWLSEAVARLDPQSTKFGPVMLALIDWCRDRGFLRFAKEMTQYWQAVEMPLDLPARVAALERAAQADRDLGDLKSADGLLQQAFEVAATASDRRQREDLETSVRLAIVETAQHPDASEIAALAERLEQEGNITRQPALLRALARSVDSDPLAAETALRRALNFHLAQGLADLSRIERIAASQEWLPTIEALMLNLVSQHQHAAALNELERVRGGGTTNVEMLAASVPEDAAIVVFYQCQGELLTWVATRAGGVRGIAKTLGPAFAPNGEVGRSRLRGAPSTSQLEIVVSDLFRVELADTLKRVSRVVFVPDGSLWSFPMDRVPVSEDGTMLIETHAVAYSASVADAARGLGPFAPIRRVLAVGNPAWDASTFGDFASLPESAAEARNVARFYVSGVSLTRSSATRDAILAKMKGIDGLHIATHAVNNERAPANSFVLLARDGNRSGALMGMDPSWHEFATARLIVFSACRSALAFGGAKLFPGGILQLIRNETPRRLVFSLTDVDDVTARGFAESFHRYVASGLDPIDALRRTTLDLGPNAPMFRVAI